MTALCEAEEGAGERLSSQLSVLFVRDMDECLCNEDTETGDVGLVPAPSLFGCDAVKGMLGCHIVEMRGIHKCIMPVLCFRK